MIQRLLVFLWIFILFPFLTGCTGNDFPLEGSTAPPPAQRISKPTPRTETPSIRNPQQSTNGSMIVLAGRDYGSLFLIEAESGEYHRLEIPGEVGINVYGWSEDGCTLIVGTETNRIVRTDINGNIKEEIVQIGDLDFVGEIILTSVTLSPDENWLAFISGTGHQEYAGYEFQSLISVSLQDQNYKTFQVTSSGWINDFSWKPDGGLIAYNDIDVNGIQQVFISEPDGSRSIQLTRFTQENLIVKSLRWSPTGEKIALAVLEKNTNTDYLVVIDTTLDNKTVSFQSIVEVNEYWWASNDIIVAIVLPVDSDPIRVASKTLSWYSAGTGEKLGELNSTILQDSVFVLPGPLTFSPRVGFFYDHSFYVYDIFSSRLERAFDQFTDMRYWISAPTTYDKEKCDSKD